MKNTAAQISNKYMVSVRLMTYRHERYIAKAIEGILSQVTDFNIEVVVGDDFSDDRTLDIIKSFNNTEKVTFKILNRSEGGAYDVKRKKLGRIYNFVNILENCSGKYIAILDGDDYWIADDKLQKQVDFLEGNSNYDMVASNALLVNENNEPIDHSSEVISDKKFTSEDIVRKNFLPTASMLFRKDVLFIPDFIYQSPAADWVLSTYVLRNSKGFFMKENLVAYRIHDGGIWAKLQRDSSKKAIRTITQNHLGNYNILHRMMSDKQLNVDTRKMARLKKESYAYQYNRMLVKNSFLRQEFKTLPLKSVNNQFKLCLVKLKLV